MVMHSKVLADGSNIILESRENSITGDCYYRVNRNGQFVKDFAFYETAYKFYNDITE